MHYITRTVKILSAVSLLTDTASEMLYPVMPIYLKTIGFSVILIGMLEGIAEAMAGLSKGYFGKLSDSTGKRVPFVQMGYAFSALSKPMMAAFTFPLWIFFARTIDRFGKGLRTGARDALLSEEAPPAHKAKVFGFHRSMDTFGAVTGPLFALVFLYFFPGSYTILFLIAFVPGLLAVAASFLLKDKKQATPETGKAAPFFSFLTYWKNSPLPYRKLVAGLLIFALCNSSDVFLLLKAKEAGLDDTTVIGIYIFYNLVYALFAFPAGMLADKAGLKTVLAAGLAMFAAVYFGMAFATNMFAFAGLFLLYGMYAAATEGVAKAWIALVTDKKDAATAMGTFSGLQSICAMGASALAGIFWFRFGATTAFVLTGTVALLVLVYVLSLAGPARRTTGSQ